MELSTNVSFSKAELKKNYEAGLIDEETFKQRLFELETTKKVKKTVKRLPVAINEDEFIALIKKTKKKEHKVAFLLGYGSGLRISEVVNLEQRHIFFKENKILIEQGKGGKDRYVPIPKGFKQDFINLFPLKYKNKKSAIRSLEIAFRVAAKKAGLLDIKPSLHFHSLRHGFATTSLSKNIPLHHLRTLLGHANISTTNVYLEANPTDALKSYEELF